MAILFLHRIQNGGAVYLVRLVVEVMRSAFRIGIFVSLRMPA
jgi:hypothetical protein